MPSTPIPSRTLIQQVEWINEGIRRVGDVLFEDGRIAARTDGEPIGTLDGPCRVIDGRGLLLLPGVIDDQVHFRDFALSAKGTIASESRAAAAGGTTSFMEMPNTQPPTTDWEAWEFKNSIGARDAAVNYAFYIGATNDNADAVLRDIPSGRICGLKIFMGSSTGRMLVDDPHVLERYFREWPGLIATHCEDEASVRAAHAAAQQRYPAGIPASAHPEIRSAAACYASSSRAVEWARRYGTRLHVLHLTTARELSLFQPGAIEGKRITSEVCVHHLTFSDADYAELGFRIKCNPAIKTEADREALWQALHDGRIDVIATDHAPHLLSEKEPPFGPGAYESAPAGLPLVQHSLGLMLAHVDAGRLSLEQMVDAMSHQVARCYGVVDRGFLRPGYFADAVLVDPRMKPIVERQDVLYHCGWSPLEGRRLGGSVRCTFVNGQAVYEEGRFDDSVRGQALTFTGTSAA